MTPRLKQPAEMLRITLPIASPVQLLEATAEPRGLVPSLQELQLVATIVSGPTGGIDLLVSAGTDGERYLITVCVQTADDQIVEREVELVVVDGGWTMPDGGTPYLSIAALVKAVGIEEALAQTDDGTGRIDRDMILRALVATQGEIDAHLAGRYAVPLPTVPPIVESIMVDRVRVRLYPRGAPDGIALASKEALRMLERIQSGAMQLGVPSADAPPAPESDAPILISPGRRAYPNGLDEY